MWVPVGVKYSSGGGTGGTTSLNLSFLNGSAGPYVSSLILTTVMAHTTCTAVSDNANGAHTKLVSIVQTDGFGELSIWGKGVYDYPVASGFVITMTVSSGADTSMMGNAVILSPELGDNLYTGGVLSNTHTALGTQTTNNVYSINNSITCPVNTQFIWTIGSCHIAGNMDDGYAIGSSGDIGGITSYWGSTTFGSIVVDNPEIFIPITPLGTGSRPNLYEPAAIGSAPFDWVAAAVSFTSPTTSMKFFAGTLGFSGDMTTILTRPYTPILARSRPNPKSQIRAKTFSQHRTAAILQARYQPLKAVQRTTTQLDSVPKDIDVAVTETYPYQVDVSNYLASGDTISSVTSVLTFMSTGAVVTSAWQGSVTTAGNVIQVIVNAPVLQLGQQYQLATTFTAATGKRLTVLSQLNMVA